MSASVILFDGVCNFCNAGINFIIRQDREKRFRFCCASIGSRAKTVGRIRLAKKEFQSFVLIDTGKVYQKSSAGLRVYNKLPWYWKWSQVFWLVPKSIRHAVYNAVAKNRYKWFGKRETFTMPTSEIKERFL